MIKRYDLLTIVDDTKYSPDDYHEKFFIDEDDLDFDDEIKFSTLDSIFQKLKSFRRDINHYIKNSYFLKTYLVYYFTVRDDLIEEMGIIENTIDRIEEQISDLKYEMNSAIERKDEVVTEFDDVSVELEEIGNVNGIVLPRSNRFLDIRKKYNISYGDLSDDDIDKVDDLLDQLESSKEEYWNIVDEVSDYEDLISEAEEHLAEAQEWKSKLEEYNFD